MTYYVGLDVSLRSVNICVIDKQGEIVTESKVDSEPEDIVAQLKPHRSQIKALGLEAGTLTFGYDDVRFFRIAVNPK